MSENVNDNREIYLLIKHETEHAILLILTVAESTKGHWPRQYYTVHEKNGVLSFTLSLQRIITPSDAPCVSGQIVSMDLKPEAGLTSHTQGAEQLAVHERQRRCESAVLKNVNKQQRSIK